MGPTNIMGQPMKRPFRQGKQPRDPEEKLPLDPELLSTANKTEIDHERVKV